MQRLLDGVLVDLTSAEEAAYLATLPTPGVLLERQRAALKAEVEARRDALLAGGFTVPTAISSALAGAVLQTRDADDKLNWLVSQGAYSAAMAMGQGAVPGAEFRTAHNITVALTFAEGLAVLLAMAAWGAGVMRASWALKDAIAAAADAAALDALDLTAGWPGAGASA